MVYCYTPGLNEPYTTHLFSEIPNETAYHALWLTDVAPETDDGLKRDADPALKPSNTLAPGAVAL